MSPIELEEMKEQLDKLEAKVFVRPSTLLWGAPVILTRKMDGGNKLCIDYRKLNRNTIKNWYQLLRIVICSISLAELEFFKLDFKSRYHQVKMKEKDIPKMPFQTQYRCYEF